MAKSNISFSLQLLKTNRKHHKEQMKRLDSKNELGRAQRVGKVVKKHLISSYNQHKKFYDDLTTAINILSAKKEN